MTSLQSKGILSTQRLIDSNRFVRYYAAVEADDNMIIIDVTEFGVSDSECHHEYVV